MNPRLRNPTEFQKKFCQDRETVLKIFEVLYPDFSFDWGNERGNVRMNPHPNYSWVMVKYKGFEFGLDNHRAYINGNSVYGKVTNETYRLAHFPFEVIPFASCKANEEITDARKERVDKILREAGYKKPSLHEWWKIYHED